jgi:type II secretory pathway pseudopilin PulG
MKTMKKIIILLLVAVISYGGYITWKNYSEQKGLEEGGSVDVPTGQIEKEEEDIYVIDEQVQTSNEGERDNQRKLDLSEIGLAIDEYAKFNKGEYPVSAGYERISDKNSSLNQMLRGNGFLRKDYSDPSSGESFYGYKSDGKSYELTAALENKSDISCVNIGSYCIYSLKKL